jgi:hypothetical protein
MSSLTSLSPGTSSSQVEKATNRPLGEMPLKKAADCFPSEAGETSLIAPSFHS